MTTRTGDGGETSLFGKGRVRKTDPRIEALGDLDEAQSAIGVARAMAPKSTLGRELLELQRGLYLAMSEVATPAEDQARLPKRLDAAAVETLDGVLDAVRRTARIEGQFVVPGENAVSAALDQARTVARRAERRVVECVDAGLRARAERRQERDEGQDDDAEPPPPEAVTDEVLWDHGMSPALAARMERIAIEVAAEWGLRLGPRIASGRYSYVAPAGEDAILKVIPPEDESASQQAGALAFWAGDGAARLLRHDPARRALLLERLVPGTEASVVSEDEAIAAAIAVGRRIWRTAPTGTTYPAITDDVGRYLPPDTTYELVPAARRAYAAMVPRADTVIHADLHHHNILRRGDEWVVIDPKPMVGEPEYDIPPFLWNPLGTSPTRARTERRIRAFADAGLDGDRIRTWAIVRGVMLGLPSAPGHRIDPDRPQLQVVRQLL